MAWKTTADSNEGDDNLEMTEDESDSDMQMYDTLARSLAHSLTHSSVDDYLLFNKGRTITIIIIILLFAEGDEISSKNCLQKQKSPRKLFERHEKEKNDKFVE